MWRKIAVGLISTLGLALSGELVGGAAPVAIQIVVGTAQNEFAFVPSEVSLRAGRPVRLTIINRGKVNHDFHIEALEAQLHAPVLPGKSASVKFTPTKKGAFEFFCRVPGHKEVGMKGVIVVR